MRMVNCLAGRLGTALYVRLASLLQTGVMRGV
jgi:hypothetical protein